MITYLPAHIVAKHTAAWCVYGKPYDYLPLYEHLARKLLAMKPRPPLEVFIDTSAVNFSEFEPFGSQKAVETILAKLFLMVGTEGKHGDFLRRIGIRRWADLAKPICLPGRENKWWSGHDRCNVRERLLRKPGPNTCHPGAIYAQRASFCFCRYELKWRFILNYGYSHDCSTWQIEVRQGTESLQTFVDRTAAQWLDSVLEPESFDHERTYRNRRHDDLTSAVGEVFATDWCSGRDVDEMGLLVKALLDGKKPALTGRRLGTFRRWMRADAKREAERQARLAADRKERAR